MDSRGKRWAGLSGALAGALAMAIACSFQYDQPSHFKGQGADTRGDNDNRGELPGGLDGKGSDAVGDDAGIPCSTPAECLFLEESGQCSQWTCDLDKGECRQVPVADEVSCDDFDPCTAHDMCVAGECLGKDETDCDDDNECTKDSCEKDKGCVYEKLTGDSCDDGNVCTADDHCEEGACTGGPECDDANPCTTGTCNPGVGCEYGPAPASEECLCSQGGLCPKGQECDKQQCVPCPEELCFDALDNDCDGFTDELDCFFPGCGVGDEYDKEVTVQDLVVEPKTWDGKLIAVWGKTWPDLNAVECLDGGEPCAIPEECCYQCKAQLFLKEGIPKVGLVAGEGVKVLGCQAEVCGKPGTVPEDVMKEKVGSGCEPPAEKKALVAGEFIFLPGGGKKFIEVHSVCVPPPEYQD